LYDKEDTKIDLELVLFARQVEEQVRAASSQIDTEEEKRHDIGRYWKSN
jgi:hypothetical protein